MDFKVKPVINKRNRQINFCIPRKKIDKKLLNQIEKGKKIKFKLRW